MSKLVVYYSSDRAEEEPPSFLDEGRCTCESLSSVLFTQNRKTVRNESDNAKEEVVVLAHGLREEDQELADYLERQGTLIIDYSSADPSYERMWYDIRTARDCCELVERLEYWIQHYTIDPIRRIKHRAMNLFAPLDTDCQYLLELWKRGEYDKARRHLEDMQKDWQGDPPYSNAPLSKLARLWYLLIGDKMEWSYQVTEVGDSTWSHISIKKPDVVISLPKKRATDEVGMCFYDWLVKIGKTGSQNWQNLLSRAGLSKSNNSFSPKSEAGIYRFAVKLQKRVIDGTLTQLRPDTPIEGFENCKDVAQNFKEFREWIRELNNAFETLVKETGE